MAPNGAITRVSFVVERPCMACQHPKIKNKWRLNKIGEFALFKKYLKYFCIYRSFYLFIREFFLLHKVVELFLGGRDYKRLRDKRKKIINVGYPSKIFILKIPKNHLYSCSTSRLILQAKQLQSRKFELATQCRRELRKR